MAMIDFENYDYRNKPNVVAWRLLEQFGEMADGNFEDVDISDFKNLDSSQMIEVIETLDDILSKKNKVQFVDRIGKLLSRAAHEHGDEAEFLDNLGLFDTAALMAYVSHQAVEIFGRDRAFFKMLAVLFLSTSIILATLLLFW